MTAIPDVADAIRDPFLDCEPIGADLPTFPVHIFPTWLRAEVEALAEAIQVPVCLPAMLSLGILSACAQRAVVVEARPGETEPALVWVLVPLLSGDGKSPCLEALLVPLRDAERRWGQELGPVIAARQSERRQLERKLQAAEQDAARAKDADSTMGARVDAARFAAEVQALVVPMVPRLMTRDATPEATSKLLAVHGRLAVFADEGGILGTIGGRYSGGDAFLDPWLRGWSAGDIQADRVTEGRSYVGTRCCLTVCLCPQPATITKMHDIPGSRDAGLLARFLFSVPASRMGYRQSILATAPVPPEVTRAYEDAIGSLLERYRHAGGADGASPRVLRLSTEALAVLDAWQRELEPRLRVSGDLRDLSDWCGKLRRAHVVRLAAVLHLAHEAGGTDVPEVGMARMLDAVALARDCLIPHARKAFALFDAEAGRESMLVPLLAAITKAGAAGLTRSECGAVFHRHRSSAEVGAALAELEREALARRSIRPTAGRHAEVWVAASSVTQ